MRGVKAPPSTAYQRLNVLNKGVVDGFDGKLTSSKWAAIARCSQDTALRDINELLACNVLKKSDASGRSTRYAIIEDKLTPSRRYNH